MRRAYAENERICSITINLSNARVTVIETLKKVSSPKTGSPRVSKFALSSVAFWQRWRISSKTNVTRTGSTPAGIESESTGFNIPASETRVSAYRLEDTFEYRHISAHREKQAHPVGLVPLIAPHSPPSREKSQEWLSANFDYICQRSISKPRRCKYRRVPTPYSWTSLESFNLPLSLSLSLYLSISPFHSASASALRLADCSSSKVCPGRFTGPGSGRGKPMETYLNGCPDDAKSNFVRRQHVSRLSKVRADDENAPPGHDWISGGRHCSRRNWINRQGIPRPPNRRLAADNRPVAKPICSRYFVRLSPFSSFSLLFVPFVSLAAFLFHSWTIDDLRRDDEGEYCYVSRVRFTWFCLVCSSGSRLRPSRTVMRRSCCKWRE